jgi:hypothetical protein
MAPVLAALGKEEVLRLLPALLQAPTSLRLIYRRLATSAGALGGARWTDQPTKPFWHCNDVARPCSTSHRRHSMLWPPPSM